LCSRLTTWSFEASSGARRDPAGGLLGGAWLSTTVPSCPAIQENR
jgi:hypothetical protein